jgi:hypothetical protein
MPDGWIRPNDPTKPGWYWLTYRTADAAPGYGWKHRDGRFRFLWSPEWDAWGESRDNEMRYVCLHQNNGWRLKEGGDEPPR